MSNVNQTSRPCHSTVQSAETTWRDYKEVIAAGVMLLIGVSISFGSCALNMYKGSKENDAERDAKKAPAMEQMVKVPMRKRMPSFIVK